MVACEESSSPQVTGLRWYHWLELRSRWHRQQYSHFDTACQRPKGKLHFLFAVMIPPSAARYFRRHLPAMSIKTTLHGTAPLLYPCRRYPKCPWGLYASPPPVAMAVVRWFLCFPAFFFFFWKNGFFFPIRDLRQKNFLRDLHQKKISVEKKRDLRQKKKATCAYFHNRVTLSSLDQRLCVTKKEKKRQRVDTLRLSSFSRTSCVVLHGTETHVWSHAPFLFLFFISASRGLKRAPAPSSDGLACAFLHVQAIAFLDLKKSVTERSMFCRPTIP